MADMIAAFRASWDSAQGDDFASRMSRRSLEADASQRSELRGVLDELKKPLQESLDLHLNGAGVRNHATDADALGRFMISLSDAVKEIAKGFSGRKRWANNLRSVAPTIGSVRLYFEVPPAESHQATLMNSQPPTFDAQALRTMANLLVQAEGAEQTLSATAQSLSLPARVAVKRIAENVVKSEWLIDGKLEVRGRPTVDLRLSEAGARRLLAAAAATTVESIEVTYAGECDGWTWSTGILRFLPEGKRPINASVPPQWQSDVAAFVSHPGMNVQATFSVTTETATGTDRSVKQGYVLTAIRKV